jgi:hypothetical protein
MRGTRFIPKMCRRLPRRAYLTAAPVAPNAHPLAGTRAAAASMPTSAASPAADLNRMRIYYVY